ncbi:hypothetical protein K9M41_04265 [Candidatus Gracilibacteria bacterium]|nr:hypothetical protein [Candidatus Gracilibacteria bacterium]
MNRKYADALVLAILMALAVMLSMFLDAEFITSIGLFFVLPSIWLSFRKPKHVKKLVVFSVIFALPFTLIIDHLAVLDNSWDVPTIFPFRIFGTVPIEDIIWGICLVYLTTIFYEYFLDKRKDKFMWRHMSYFFVLVFLLLTTFTFFLVSYPELLHIPYTYLVVGLAFVLMPTILVLISFPHLLTKFFSTLAYFFPLALLMELTALILGHWSFPGKNFIGWVDIMGQKFPFEELFFWFLLLPIAILSYYEFFNDDRR